MTMDVHIGELVSTIHAADGPGGLDPETTQRIVQAVVRAIEESERRAGRARSDRRIGGVADEAGSAGEW